MQRQDSILCNQFNKRGKQEATRLTLHIYKYASIRNSYLVCCKSTSLNLSVILPAYLFPQKKNIFKYK